MSRKTRKLIWSAPLVAVLAVIGVLAIFAMSTPGGAQAQGAILGPPTGLTAMADGQTKIKLSWTAPSGEVIGYRIDVAKDKDGAVWEELLAANSADIALIGNIGRYTHEGLKAENKRHYRVFAIDGSGNEGEPSEVASATTSPATKPGVPIDLATSGIEATADTITLDWGWTDMSPTGGSDITGFEIQKSDDGRSGWMTLKTLKLTDAKLVRLPEALGDDLEGYRYADKVGKAGTTRYYRVRAMNKVASGDWSDGVSGMTGTAPVLTAPENLKVQGSNSQVMLYWTAPDDPLGAPVTGYRIERSRDGIDWVAEKPFDTNSTATSYRAGGSIHTVDNPATQDDETARWQYRIRAINAAGAAPDGAVLPSEAITLPDSATHGPVVSLKAEPINQKSIRVSWSEPAVKPADGTIAYTIFTSKDGKAWSAISGNTGMSHDHTGLKARETHYYMVFANTSGGSNDGEHRVSQRVSATTRPAVPPAAPEGLTAIANSTKSASQIDLTITRDGDTIAAEHDSGGAEVTGYEIRRSTNRIAWEVSAANFDQDHDLSVAEVQYQDKGLTAGTTYYYEVRAINTAGPGAAVRATAATSSAVALDPPQGLVAIAKGRSKVNLYWLTPGDPDGAPVTGYWIEVSEDAGSTWTNVKSNTGSKATMYTHTGNLGGKSLTYRVSAINSEDAGAGPASVNKTVMVPAAAVPGAPMASASADSTTQITVMWDPPADTGGSAITGYVLQKMMGTEYMTIAATDAATWWEALDCAGMIAAVADTRTDTPAEDPKMDAFCKHYPGTPKASSTATTLTAASKMVVDSTFAANYETITGTSYMDMDLMANTKYSYRVAAVNAVGKGGYGMTMATTMAPTMPQEAVPPTGVKVTKLLSSITVEWDTGSAENTTLIKVVLYNETVTALAAGVTAPVVSFKADADPGTYTYNGVPAGTYKVGVAVVDHANMHKVHLVSEPVTITAGQ